MRQRIAQATEKTIKYFKSLAVNVKEFKTSKFKSGTHCAIRKFKRNRKLVAVKCHCGHNTFHPVINGIIMWGNKTTVHYVLKPKKKRLKRILNSLRKQFN